MQAKVGDTVRFLNTTGGGRVTKIEGQIAYVDDDGFETPILLRECVVVATGDSFYKVENKQPKAAPTQASAAAPAKTKEPEPALPDVEETPEGEKLNVVLGFEPIDIKRLSSTTFDAYLVNDSNYYLYFSVATRAKESDQFKLRYAGLVEPAMQEFLFELTPDDLPDIDRIAFQAFAFKRDKDYAHKPTINVEQRLDATKFARLHCFAENPYFDEKVLAIELVKDDVVAGHREIAADTAVDLKKALQEKQRDDRRAPRPITKHPTKAANGPLEIDLHAGELLDSTAGLSSADILNYQIDTFRRVMDENLKNVGREIVFIHGKGEGVLRQALMKELNHRYKGHDVSDASFREYGFGATKVVIRRIR
jgi:hypothetical protein